MFKKNPKQHKEVGEKIYEQSDNLASMIRFISTWGGIFNNNSTFGILRFYSAIVFCVIGLMHYTLYIFLDNLTFSDKMETCHWIVFFILMTFCSLVGVFYRVEQEEMFFLIKNEFYLDRDWLNQEQKEIIGVSNKTTMLRTKQYLSLAFITLFVTMLKEPIFSKEEWATIFKGWFPFVINSWPRYTFTIIFHMIVGINAVSCGATFITSWLAFLKTLSCHLKVLKLSISQLTENDSSCEAVKLKIKFCVVHHHIILRYFNILQKIVSIPLFLLSLFTGVFICTLGMILLQPVIDKALALELLLVITTEMSLLVISSIQGQELYDLSESLMWDIYECKWYEQTVPVQKMMATMIIGVQRPLHIKAGGLQSYTLAGLQEVIQASYSFFNMIKAAR